jgi:hypothetical protein
MIDVLAINETRLDSYMATKLFAVIETLMVDLAEVYVFISV